MRIGAAVILGIVIILMTIQIGVFYKRNRGLEKDFAQILEASAQAEDDYQQLQADYEYYQNPENLEKELRARFHYRNPDESMIIIVPKATSSASTTE